ncbi:MAG: hypothetical protein ACE5IJ_11465 [Thermoplasmata archaeon]
MSPISRVLLGVALLSLIGVFLLPVATSAGKGKPGGVGGLYQVIMSNPRDKGMITDCDLNKQSGNPGYVLARWETRGGGSLHADEDDLNLHLVNAEVDWTRVYDAGLGTAGTFDGCFGVTEDKNGNLFIFFETMKGESTVRFIWHFEYYIFDSGEKGKNRVYRYEHFTLDSEPIPFPAWRDEGISGHVKGTFDLKYYLREDNKIIHGYDSLTGGEGIPFEFDLVIVPKP